MTRKRAPSMSTARTPPQLVRRSRAANASRPRDLIDDGSERDGWPVDVANVASNGSPFDPGVAFQRGALALVGDHLYVPYGSLQGLRPIAELSSPSTPSRSDPAVVVTIPPSSPPPVTAWVSPGLRSACGRPKRVSATAAACSLPRGTAPAPRRRRGRRGGRVPLRGGRAERHARRRVRRRRLARPRHVRRGPRRERNRRHRQNNPKVPELVVALGKDGNLYALDAAHMGRPGAPPLLMLQVATHDIVDARRRFRIKAARCSCSTRRAGAWASGARSGRRAESSWPSRSRPAPPIDGDCLWRARASGSGSPIITTNDGSSEPIVWMTGGGVPESPGADYAIKRTTPTTGASSTMRRPRARHAGMYRFNTLIVANGRLLVAADNRAYQFAFK